MRNIYPIILIILTGIIFFLAIDPFYKQVKTIKEDIVTYDDALNNSKELQKSRDSLLAIYNNIEKEDMERLNHFLPDNIGNIELILEIEKIANLNGMPMGDIQFDARTLDGEDKNDSKGKDDNLPYGIFPMKFKVTGKYESFLSFLRALEHNLRMVDITSIDFRVPATIVSADGKETTSGIYDYSFEIETYWLK